MTTMSPGCRAGLSTWRTQALSLSVGGSAQSHAGGAPTQANRVDHRGGLPMSGENSDMNPLTARRTSTTPRPIGFDAGIIQKDQT